MVGFGFLFVFDLNEDNSNLFRLGKSILGAPMLASILLGVFVILKGRLVARTREGAQASWMASPTATRPGC